MSKPTIEQEPALIEATARKIAEGMGDNPDDIVFMHQTLPKTRSGRVILSVAQNASAPAWTVYASAAEAVLRYLLVERIVLVKRDLIDPAVKAKVLEEGEFTTGDTMSFKTTMTANREDFAGMYCSRAADSADVLTEDDVTNPVVEALQVIIEQACLDGDADRFRVSDALDTLSRVGYLSGAARSKAHNPEFWSLEYPWKPSREAVWRVVQFAGSVNGVGSDFVCATWAKLFPGGAMPAWDGNVTMPTTPEDHST